MTMGESNTSHASEPFIPAPWEGVLGGVFVAFLILVAFGPLIALAGMLVGGIVGGLIDAHRNAVGSWTADAALKFGGAVLILVVLFVTFAL